MMSTPHQVTEMLITSPKLAHNRRVPTGCEFTIRDKLCGKPVAYRWAPRSNPRNFAYVCRYCGESVVGNYKDELTPAPATAAR